jgi:CubicO group peptidase (beta-lactamase class C family)
MRVPLPTSRFWRAIWVAVALFAATLVGSARPSRGTEIADAIKSRVDSGKSTGMVVARINPDGSTSTSAYGDPGPDALPLDGDSVFEIGSITKVFTATLLVEMADRGEVKFEDPVEVYLPAGTRVPQRNGRKITLFDLATQSSGLPRMPGNFRPGDPANPYADYTPAQLYEFLAGHTLRRDIGSEYEYTNVGVALLGHALARRAGTSYEAILRERVLAPLHMDHTAVTLTPWMTRHLAKGHNAAGNMVANWDLPTFAGAGGLRSSMTDMLLFARANLDESGGRLQRLMQQTHGVRRSAGRPDMDIGLAWHIRHVDGHDVVWHNGGTGGYRTWIGFDKARRTAAVVLTNSQQGHDDLGVQLVTGGR